MPEVVNPAVYASKCVLLMTKWVEGKVIGQQTELLSKIITTGVGNERVAIKNIRFSIALWEKAKQAQSSMVFGKIVDSHADTIDQ